MAKKTINKTKRPSKEWEKIFANGVLALILKKKQSKNRQI